jgi:hypothetical protein
VNNAVSRAAGVLAVAATGAVALAAFAGNLDAAARARPVMAAPEPGAARPPEGLSAEEAAVTTEIIQRAFASTFRLLGLIAAGLAWLSALLA